MFLFHFYRKLRGFLFLGKTLASTVKRNIYQHPYSGEGICKKFCRGQGWGTIERMRVGPLDVCCPSLQTVTSTEEHVAQDRLSLLSGRGWAQVWLLRLLVVSAQPSLRWSLGSHPRHVPAEA